MEKMVYFSYTRYLFPSRASTPHYSRSGISCPARTNLYPQGGNLWTLVRSQYRQCPARDQRCCRYAPFPHPSSQFYCDLPLGTGQQRLICPKIPESCWLWRHIPPRYRTNTVQWAGRTAGFLSPGVCGDYVYHCHLVEHEDMGGWYCIEETPYWNHPVPADISQFSSINQDWLHLYPGQLFFNRSWINFPDTRFAYNRGQQKKCFSPAPFEYGWR